MKDSRITVWTNPTAISGTGTTNGPTVDLFNGTVPNGNFNGTSPCGVGVEILIDSVTGTDPTFTYNFEVSDDTSTWVNAGHIGQHTDTSVAPLFGTLRTVRRYFRIVVVAGGTSPAANVNAYPEDFRDLYAEGVD